MPKLTGPFFSVEAHGALAKALTYQRRPGGASVYGYKKPKVPLTFPQLYQRHTILAAVQAWQYAGEDLRSYYEAKAEGRGQSGYSLWMHERAFKCGGVSLYLPMVECAGVVVHDVSGFENDGDIIGATWTDLGRGLWCLDFDGQDNYVDCGIGERLYGSAFTYEAWINISSFTNYGSLFSVGFLAHSKGTYLNAHTGGILNFVVHDGVSGKAVTAYGVLSLGTWYQVVATFDGSKMELFLDTVSKGTNTQNPVVYDTSRPALLGRWEATTGYWFSGLIVLPRIYNRVLSNTEIQKHFSLEKSLFGV